MSVMVTQHPLRAYRKRQQPPLKKAGLARLLEVSKTTIARWEAGIRKIDPDLLANVAEKTGIPERDLRPDLAELFSAPQIEEVAR